MASITGTATVVNTSGNYSMSILDCATDSLITFELFIGTTNGTVSHTITDSLLDANLGSIKVRITDTQEGGKSSLSSCFNHSCTIPPSITNVVGTSYC